MRAEVEEVVDEGEITEGELSVLHHAIAKLDHLLHNRKVSIRLKEKRDLEHKLEMSHCAEDVRDAENTIESYIQKYPDATKPYQEWLEKRRSEIRRAEEVES